jgi:hypothetical protein
MNVLVCGGRHYEDKEFLYSVLDSIKDKIDLVIQGASLGADKLAFEWTLAKSVPCLSVPADWNKHGYAAGSIRNKKMLTYAPDLVLAFQGGRGTNNMIRQAEEKAVKVIKFEQMVKLMETNNLGEFTDELLRVE